MYVSIECFEVLTRFIDVFCNLGPVLSLLCCILRSQRGGQTNYGTDGWTHRQICDIRQQIQIQIQIKHPQEFTARVSYICW